MIDAAIASAWRLDHARARALVDATAADPFAILGPHRIAGGTIVRAFLPRAAKHVTPLDEGMMAAMQRNLVTV